MNSIFVNMTTMVVYNTIMRQQSQQTGMTGIWQVGGVFQIGEST